MSASGQPVFVVSTGRCGSTALSSVLAEHGDVLSVSELLMALNSKAFVHASLTGETFWRLLSKPRSPMRYILTPQTCPREFLYDFQRSKLFTQSTLPPILYMMLPSISDDPDVLYFELEAAIRPRPLAPLQSHYGFLLEWLSVRLGKRCAVERSGGSLMFVEPLMRLFPDAKFIHLYRDGRETALSIREYPPLRLLAQSWAEARAWGVDLLRPPFRIGESPMLAAAESVMAPLVGVRRRLDKPISLSVVGAFWSEMIVRGLAAFDRIPTERRLNVRYEDLAADPATHLAAILQFVDPTLEHEPWLSQAVGRLAPAPCRRTQLPREDRLELEKACAPGLQALGYLEDAMAGMA